MRTTVVFVVALASVLAGADAKAQFIFGTPVNLGPSVNTTGSDGSPSVSADGMTLYFDSLRPGGLGDWDIWVSKARTPHSGWGEAELLPAPVNSPYADAGPFSVYAWIKGGAPGQVVVSQAGSKGTGQNWLCAESSEGKFISELRTGGRGGHAIVSQTIITDGLWHEIGFAWDGSYRSLYVDGREVAKDETSLTELATADGGLFFGAGSNLGEGTFFSGLIDDIRIYNKAVAP